MDGIVIIGILAAVALIAAAAKPSQSKILGMEDTPVSIENIRRGVANGWYDCVLIRVDGKPAVRLSGKTTSGQYFSDVYPITQADFDTLQKEGYLIVL